MRRDKGSVTVFYALIMIPLIALAGSLFDGARVSTAKVVTLDKAYMAADNILACYERELWDDYHLLGYDVQQLGYDEGIKDKVGDYLKDGNISWFSSKQDIISLAPTRYFNDTSVLAEQIKAYMKYASIGEIVELITEGSASVTDMKQTKSSIEEKLEVEKESSKADEKKLKAMETVSELDDMVVKLKTGSGDVSVEYAERALARTELCQRQFAEYDSSYDVANEVLEKYRKELRNTPENSYFEEELNSLAEYNKRERDRANRERDVIGRNGSIISEMVAIERQREGYVAALPNAKGPAAAAIGEAIASCDERLNEKRAQLTVVHENGPASGKKIKNPVASVSEILAKGLMGMILPSEYEISQRKAKPEDESYIHSGSEEETLIFEVLYCGSHFNSYLREDACERAGQELSYELEYIICGSGSDEANLSTVAEEILAVRTAICFVNILNDEARMLPANEIALAVAGVTGVTPAVLAIKTAILLSWAVQDAIEEEKLLYRGEKLASLPGESGCRLGYSDYLRIFLLGLPGHVRLSRVLDLICMNMKSGYNSGFSADKIAGGIEYSYELSVSPLFFEFADHKNQRFIIRKEIARQY